MTKVFIMATDVDFILKNIELIKAECEGAIEAFNLFSTLNIRKKTKQKLIESSYDSIKDLVNNPEKENVVK